MDIIKLKQNIEDNKLSDNLLIFVNWDRFLLDQYIKAIAKGRLINKLDSIDQFLSTYENLFGDIKTDSLDIYNVDDFKCLDKKLLSQRDLIIICNKISDADTKDLFSEVIIESPKIEKWCVKDYLYSALPELKDLQKDWLLDICNYDLFRLQQEIDKLKIFNKKDREKLFDNFVKDHVFDDLISFTIFEFIDCIITKNKHKLAQILEQIKYCDIEPLGVLTLCYNNFKNIINVQMSNNPTPESTGLNPKQLYAIKHKTGYYSQYQLIDIFEFLTLVDYKLKTGELPADKIIDYILINIFGD